MRGLSPGAAGLLLAALALGLAPLEARGQEQARPRGCTLVLEPTPSTQSIRRRVGPEQYITHLWGGMRWTCGTARMVADSAVKYDPTGRLVMIGSVDYQDSVRTLTSDTLTYFEGEDRIVAEGRVRLTRTATGSTLEGPHVVFFRSRGGDVERTVARERAHMVLRRGGASGDGGAPPVVLDADSAVFVGDTRVRTWGDVRIERPGRPTTGRADSASFWTEEGRAELYGSPRVTGEAFRLTGRLVRLGLEEGALRSVEAVEEGRATGEEFDLFGARIRARMAEEELERLWAYGEGRSVALSPPYRLAADSLDFAFLAGELDTVTSVGEATAVEVGPEPPEDPMVDVPLTVGEERNWVTGDTLYVAFGAVPSDTAAPGEADGRTGEAADTAATRRDTAAGSAGAAAQERRIRSMRAVGHARAYYLVRPDSARGPGGQATGTEEGRRGRTYQIGREIVVYFERGEASRVRSREAIGVYLDPIPGPAGPADTASEAPPPGRTAADSAPASAADTTGDGT